MEFIEDIQEQDTIKLQEEILDKYIRQFKGHYEAIERVAYRDAMRDLLNDESTTEQAQGFIIGYMYDKLMMRANERNTSYEDL